MNERVVVVDFSPERRAYIIARMRARFRDVVVSELATSPYDAKANTDFAKLEELKAIPCDMLIAHIGGNPSGYECLKTFKEVNPSGKAILFTKMDAIPITQLEGLKLANAVFRRADDDSRAFANDDEVLDLIARVRREPALVASISACDVAFVCAVPPELTALIDAFGGEESWRPLPSTEQSHIYRQTEFLANGGAKLQIIVGAPTYMGLTATAILATQMILSFRPKLIAMVGIAAGTRSAEREYGDILVADPSVDYASGKVSYQQGAERFDPDPYPISIDTALRTRLQDDGRKRAGLDELMDSWRSLSRRNELPERKLRLHVGPVGAADQVVDSRERVEEIQRNWRKLIGIEMETYALYRAAKEAPHPRPLYVSFKAVCDFAAEKNDKWQEYAAFTAAGYAKQFLFNHSDALVTR